MGAVLVWGEVMGWFDSSVVDFFLLHLFRFSLDEHFVSDELRVFGCSVLASCKQLAACGTSGIEGLLMLRGYMLVLWAVETTRSLKGLYLGVMHGDGQVDVCIVLRADFKLPNSSYSVYSCRN